MFSLMYGEVFELNNKMGLSKLLNLHFCFVKKKATQMSSFSKNTYLREYKELGFLLS